MITMTESQLQAECFQWFWNEYPDLRRTMWSVPNEGQRHWKVTSKLKATGLVTGVHDLHWIHSGQFYTFELKVGVNKLSGEQKSFWAAVTEQGAICHEIRDVLQFKKIVSKIVV